MRLNPVTLVHAARGALSRHRWFLLAAGLSSVVFAAVLTGGTFQFDYAEPLGSFYDYQAASLLQGRLDVPEAAISIEAFVVDGRYYGYFGPTPALLRIPLVIFKLGVGRLSRIFMAAYFVAAMVAAYRILIEASRIIEGESGVPRKGTVLCFLLNVGLGSSLFFLGSSAYLYHEAILCGVAFALWSVWCTLRHHSSPGGRWWLGALACGVLSVHARPSVGLFALTFLGSVATADAIRICRDRQNLIALRRPLFIGCLALLGALSFNGLSYLKFKTFEGCPLRFNVQYGPARLAKIENTQFHVANIPFAMATYLARPSLTITKGFPYIQIDRESAPSSPRTKLDLLEPTLALPFACPGLFALAALGGMVAFVRSPGARPALVVLLTAVVPMSLALFSAVVISHRYTADFCPALIAGAAFGAIAVARLPRPGLTSALVGVTVVAILITLPVTVHHQGERVWATSEQTRDRYESVRRAADNFFGLPPARHLNVDAFVIQGTLLLTSRHAAGAVAQFEAALRRDPNHAVAHQNLAGALIELGRYSDALAHGLAALQSNAGLIDAHRFCAEALLAEDRVNEAIDHLELVARQRPGDSDAQARLGSALFRAGRMPGALTSFSAALRLAPSDPEAHFNVGLVLAQSGRAAEAIAEFETALRLKPDFAQARDCLRQLRPTQDIRPPK